MARHLQLSIQSSPLSIEVQCSQDFSDQFADCPFPGWSTHKGEPKPSSNASQAQSRHGHKTPTVANGTPGNGGGSTWGNNGNNDHNTQGWGASSIKSGSKPGGNGWDTLGQNKDNFQTWGTPSNKSGSKAGGDAWAQPGTQSNRNYPNSTSRQPSRPGSNAGANGGDWNGQYKSGKSRNSWNAGSTLEWPRPSADVHHGRQGSHSRRDGNYSRLDPHDGGFRGSQAEGLVTPATMYSTFYDDVNGPLDWGDKPSDQATGPSTATDWRNKVVAQDTHGKSVAW